MRANHSPLQFFGLIATVCVSASGVYANAAQAGTIASTTTASGASASPVLAGRSSASETGTRSRVDGTRTAVGSNRTSRALRNVSTTPLAGGLLSPTSGPPASGSATPGRQLVQVTTPAAPAHAAPPTPASQATRVDIGVTPLVGGGNSAGAPMSATGPPARTTTTAATDPSLADSAARIPLATQLPAHALATKPSTRRSATTEPQATPATTTPAVAARPSATRAGTHPSVRRPPATQPVAAAPPTSAPPAATPPSATNSVATKPVATQSLRAQSAPLSRGNRTRRLHHLQSLVTQWLRAEKDHAARPVTPADSLLSNTPSHLSLGLAKGPLGPDIGSPRVLAGDADLESGSASGAAGPRRQGRATKPPSVARPRAAMAPPIPQALSPAPTVLTRLPVGGAAAATGGGVGSVAPSVVAEFEAVAVALATILLARFFLAHAIWRSTLLASRLERPG